VARLVQTIARGFGRLGWTALNTLVTMIAFASLWACTTCGACIEFCPVGNEPMRDILEIRCHLVLMENAFPKQLQAAFRGMERTATPWNIPPEERLAWAEGLEVPTVVEHPAPEMLWWVGCALHPEEISRGLAGPGCLTRSSYQ